MQGLQFLFTHFAKIAMECKCVICLPQSLAQMKSEFTYQVCCESDEYPRSYEHLFT